MWDEPRDAGQGYPEWPRHPERGRTRPDSGYGSRPPHEQEYGAQWNDDTTEPAAPPFQRPGSQYPGAYGQPWNPPAPTRPAPQQYGQRDRSAYPPPPQAVRQVQRAPAYAPPREEHRPHARRSLPHLPIAHVFLILGVGALAYAISQPWGIDGSGATIFVRDFSNAQLAANGVDVGAMAVKVATGIAIAAGAMAVILILLNTVVTILNRVLGFIGLSGCASLIFFPVLWGAALILFVVLVAGAGFAGIGSLDKLPLVRDHGFTVTSVQSYALGYYLWVGGLIVSFVGMLGQLVLRRR